VDLSTVAKTTIHVALRDALVNPRTGEAFVTVVGRCTDTGWGQVRVQVRQLAPQRRIIDGSGGLDVACNGRAHAWHLLVQGKGAFVPGWARVTVDASACTVLRRRRVHEGRQAAPPTLSRAIDARARPAVRTGS
jgi:hypothetical protein